MSAELPEGALLTSLARRHRVPANWRCGEYEVARGDLVLCEVVQVGCYRAMEVFPGHDVELAPGRHIVAVAGTRQSSTSLAGTAPAGRLEPGTPLDLLAVGGVVGRCEAVPSDGDPPTRLRYIAVVCDGSGVVRLRDGTDERAALPAIPIVFVTGTAAEVGKTRLTADIVRLLAGAGLRVGACKLKGTGRMRDLDAYGRAGARSVVDFVDAGLESTYELPVEVIRSAARRILAAAARGNDVVVAELGGDLLGGGGEALLADADLQRAVNVLLLVGSDVFALSGGSHFLRSLGWRRPVVFGPTRRNNIVSDHLVRRLTDEGLILDEHGLLATLQAGGVAVAGMGAPS